MEGGRESGPALQTGRGISKEKARRFFVTLSTASSACGGAGLAEVEPAGGMVVRTSYYCPTPPQNGRTLNEAD